MSAELCAVCHRDLGQHAVRLRYEMRTYAFDGDACKQIFQENPDRYLDAEGGVLPEPRG